MDIKKTEYWPKISVITPSYNQGKYLEETILSVIGQNYPNLEYIIIDGGSTDDSVDIIRKYKKYLAYWISEKDNGLYDAINKGMSLSTGEIMGWLNSDDILFPNALRTVAEVFNKFNEVNLITGMPVSIDENGRIISTHNSKSWSYSKFLSGNYKWIQQESTYWRRSLWEMSGEYIDIKYKLAADFELWLRFLKLNKIYTLNIVLAGFRKRRNNQKSQETYDEYMEEVNEILRVEKLNLTNKEKLIILTIKVLDLFKRNISIYKSSKYITYLQRKLLNVPPKIVLNRKDQALKMSN